MFHVYFNLKALLLNSRQIYSDKGAQKCSLKILFLNLLDLFIETSQGNIFTEGAVFLSIS